MYNVRFHCNAYLYMYKSIIVFTNKNYKKMRSDHSVRLWFDFAIYSTTCTHYMYNAYDEKYAYY